MIQTVEHGNKRHLLSSHSPAGGDCYYVEFLCEVSNKDMQICLAVENLVAIGEFERDPLHCSECLIDYNKRSGR